MTLKHSVNIFNSLLLSSACIQYRSGSNYQFLISPMWRRLHIKWPHFFMILKVWDERRQKRAPTENNNCRISFRQSSKCGVNCLVVLVAGCDWQKAHLQITAGIKKVVMADLFWKETALASEVPSCSYVKVHVPDCRRVCILRWCSPGLRSRLCFDDTEKKTFIFLWLG